MTLQNSKKATYLKFQDNQRIFEQSSYHIDVLLIGLYSEKSNKVFTILFYLAEDFL
jgi:hypothetical protein